MASQRSGDVEKKIPDSFSADAIWLIVIGALALALRVAYATQYGRHPLGALAWADEAAYWRAARRILAGYWIPLQPFYQDPLYPYVLAALMSVVGTGVFALRVALACVGSLTPLAVYWAGRETFGRTQAVLAGLAAACYGPFVFQDAALEKEGLGALVAALALAYSARALRAPNRPRAAFAAGICWGMLALLRANALLIGPLAAAWMYAAQRRSAQESATSTRAWPPALALVVGFAASIAPVTAINALVAERPELIVTTWQAGANFYIGNNPGAIGSYTPPPFVRADPAHEADDFAAEAARRAGRKLSYGEVSRFWFAEGLRSWRDEPLASLRLLGRKLRFVLSDFEIPDNQSMELVGLVAAPVLRWAFLSFGWILPLAALGVPRALRSASGGLVLAVTALGLLSTALFFVVGRYRIPFVPGLLLLAACGAVDAQLFVARRWRAVAGRLVLLAAPAALLAWLPTADPTTDRWGEFEVKLFNAYLMAGRLDDAIDALDDAMAQGPRPALYMPSRLRTGAGHDRLLALADNRVRALAGDPQAAELAKARYDRVLPERRAASRRALEALIESDPTNRAAWRELGAWWLAEADDPEARQSAQDALEHAVEPPPSDPSAAILLALLKDNESLLDVPAPPRSHLATRLRVARAILEHKNRFRARGP